MQTLYEIIKDIKNLCDRDKGLTIHDSENELYLEVENEDTYYSDCFRVNKSRRNDLRHLQNQILDILNEPRINDNLRDRNIRIAEYWVDGYSFNEIGKDVLLTGGSVSQIVSKIFSIGLNSLISSGYKEIMPINDIQSLRRTNLKYCRDIVNAAKQ